MGKFIKIKGVKWKMSCSYKFAMSTLLTLYSGMRKFRIDQDFLIEHWHIIYIMPVVFAEIYY